MREVVFLSGLPRTGSTVLASMLNQHPGVHATTTSPVADLVASTIEVWPNISRALINPDKRQVGGILSGIINGAHQHIAKGFVIDKNRLWPRLAGSIYETTGKKPKIICTVRSITEIMASYIILADANGRGKTFIDRDILASGLQITTKNRCEVLLQKYIRHPYDSLRIGCNSGSADMLMLEYSEICSAGQAVVDKICKFIECSPYTVNTGNLQSMDENDEWHGGIKGLHYVRQTLGRTSPPPEAILGRELVDYYNSMKLEFWR